MFLAQIPVQTEPNIEAVQDASFLFNGPQFFAALIAGVVLAFAFQLLFTNFAVAAGISLVGNNFDSSQTDDDALEFGSTIKKVGIAVGLGTLFSVTLALFLACILAVKLGFFISPLSGAIVGLVIWATFFVLMTLFSSKAIGSLLGSVTNTATSGIQAILGTATAALGADAASQKIVNTAETAAAAVRKELGMAIDPIAMRENVEDFLYSVNPLDLDLNKIAQDFERLLEDENLQEIVDSDSISQINRSTFVSLISDRSDLSKKDAQRIASKLESVWKKTTDKLTPSTNPLSDFTNYIKTATKEELLGNDLGSKIDSLIDEIGKKSGSPAINPLTQATTLGLNSLVSMVMGRTDLSDLDVDKIVKQLQKLQGHLSEQTETVTSQLGFTDTAETTIKKDIKNYLLNSYPWQLKPQNLDREFRNLIYDPQADPQAVARELRDINRADFAEILQQKGILTQSQIRQITNHLENICLEVLATAQAAQEREKKIELMKEVEEYLTTTTKKNLIGEKIQIEFKPILEDFEATEEELTTRLAVLDRFTLMRMLELRRDMDEIAASAIANELEIARDQVLEAARQDFGQAKAIAERQWLKVQSYLRDTERTELNPDGIKKELQLLLRDPQAGSSALNSRLAQFDRDTLVQLLSQRQDLTEEQIDHTINTVEALWKRMSQAPDKLVGKAQEQYEQASSAIADYLHHTGKPELNPEGIKQREFDENLREKKG
ncbi:hypothetical protein Xen7305DRAFT_00049710 [Xenococcus sp. PCC 7305]|uniref:MFS transporter n=1 Tax=Xenococcus sp. PCC 7305 TaxID=102125 RepID=UPI0002ACD5C6|nr:MFS transporter [Xenococcus sp. PCC 7305]ELS05228.1 hypothetical protein Xen7305DRAFT_00049710 [Xenococcus sp. PCC 7305]